MALLGHVTPEMALNAHLASDTVRSAYDAAIAKVRRPASTRQPELAISPASG